MAIIGLNINLNLIAAESEGVPPPPAYFGNTSWGSHLTTVEASIIARMPSSLNLPSEFRKDIWGGWFSTHAASMVSEPASYARWDHESWLRIITAYGVLGRGNFYDPLIEESRKSVSTRIDQVTNVTLKNATDADLEKRKSAFDEITKGVPFWVFANIPQIELLKDEKHQDALVYEITQQFDLLFAFMPKTHREGYVQLGKHVEDVISQPGWYERELAYYLATVENKQQHLFTQFGPDGKPDPFRKGIAFVFRRVYDKTITPGRATAILKQLNGFFGRIHAREGENTHVHNPNPPEGKEAVQTKDRFFEELQAKLKKIEETK
ncbi:MAG: hypothetical protein FGM57_00380 [Candidatus Taylorbacteria bacterium]|nr:hypothetical protein [Candidatus Taylorbacteria bacterium]